LFLNCFQKTPEERIKDLEQLLAKAFRDIANLKTAAEEAAEEARRKENKLQGEIDQLKREKDKCKCSKKFTPDVS